MRRRLRAAGLPAISFLLACAAASARADSVFSSLGYGRWNHAVDVRSAGMGDVSLAPSDGWSFSPANPATLAAVPHASAYLSAGSDFTAPDVGPGSPGTRADARIPIIAVALPITRGIVAGLHLQELNDGRYHIEQRIDGDPSYELRSKGTGSWTEATFEGAGTIAGGWMAGVQIGIPFSAIEDEVVRDFETEGYTDRSLVTRTQLKSAIFKRLGAGFLSERLAAGGYFELPETGRIATTLELPGDDAQSEYSIGVPAAFGIAGSVGVSPSLWLSGEYRHQAWGESTELRGQPWREEADALGITRGFNDVDAWGVGAEWRRNVSEQARSAWEHLMLRAGYAIQPWNVVGPNQGDVRDRTITAGLGIPFVRGNGQFDVALRYTTRDESTSDLAERIFSLSFGMSYTKQPREY